MPDDYVYFCDCAQCGDVRRRVHASTWSRHRLHRSATSECNHPFRENAGPDGVDYEPILTVRRRAAQSHNPINQNFDNDENLREELPLIQQPEIDDNPRAHSTPPPRAPSPDQPDDENGDEQWESQIDAVRTAQQYIARLRQATLDDGRLSPQRLERLLAPPQTSLALSEDANGDLLLSLRLFLSHTTSSEANYENSRAAVKIRFPGCNVLSVDAVQSTLEEITGVYALYNDLCVNSCLAYTGPYSDALMCPFCHEPRYELNTTRPRNKMITIPLGPQIQAMHRHEETAELLDYWSTESQQLLDQLERGDEIRQYCDVFCGSDITSLLQDGALLPDDTVLMLSVDGAQLYRYKKSSCWVAIAILLNFSPALGRYTVKRVLPQSVTPGPEKPKLMESVIFPALHHISAVNRHGGLPIWDAYRATERYLTICTAQGRPAGAPFYTSGLFLLLATADAEAMPVWNGLVGHSGKHGCRLWCPMPSRRISGQRGGHYYPMMAKPDDYNLEGCDHPSIDYDRPLSPCSQERYLAALQEICRHDLSTRDYELLRRESGISKPSLLLGLWVSHERPMILGVPRMCPGDSMHEVINIARQMLSLWRGATDCLATDNRATWDWVVLTGDVWKQHGKDVEACIPHLPTLFERAPRNIAEKINSGYKATEYLTYFFVYGPALLYRVLPTRYWEHYCKLVTGFRLLYQKSVTRSQIDYAETLLTGFLRDFEVLYIRGREDRMHFITQVFHNLWHMAPETRRLGPGSLYAQWTLERTIGNLTDEMKQHSDPYQNLAQRALRRAQTNALKALYPAIELEKDRNPPLPQGSLQLADDYVLLPAVDRASRTLNEQDEIDAIRELMITRDLAEEFTNWLEDRKVLRWACLRLPNGHKARSVWGEARIKSANKRRTVNVKIVLDDGNVTFAYIRYFVQIRISEAETITAAMVEYYAVADNDLFNRSERALLTVKLTGEPGMVQAIDYRFIKSVITVPPCPTSLGRGEWEGQSFVGEKMGLDIAWFDIDNIDNDRDHDYDE